MSDLLAEVKRVPDSDAKQLSISEARIGVSEVAGLLKLVGVVCPFVTESMH